MRHSLKWLWGFIPLAVLLWAAMTYHGPVITQDVAARSQANLKAEGFTWSSLAVQGRDLTLSGTAPNGDSQTLAAAAADRVNGVRLVNNAIELAKELKPYPFAAAKEGRDITLTGAVPSQDVREALVAGLKKALPDAAITDRLELARGAPQGFADLAAYALGQLGTLSSGKMALSDKALTIEGIAPNADVFAAVSDGLKALPRDGALASANIQLVAARPFRLDAVSDGTTTVLSGHVGSAATRAALLKAAKGKATDRMTLAGGEPRGFVDAASLGLAQIGKLKNGTLTIIDQAVTIEGLAADQATREAVLAAMKAQPQGFTLASARIDVAQPVQKPYLLTYERSNNGLVLKGFVPSEEARKAVLNASREAFAGVNITDQLALADGVPAGMDWVAANRAGLLELAKLKSGVAGFRDEVFSISGEIEDAERLTGLEAALKRLGFKIGSFAVRAPAAMAPPPAPVPAIAPPLAPQPVPPPPIAPVERPRLSEPALACQTLLDRAVDGEVVLFRTGSHAIRDESDKLIERVASAMKQCPNYIIGIEGHTDSDGAAEANMSLSERRAKAVAEALTDLGVSRDQLRPVGFGQSRPVASNDSAEGKAKNRRIEFIVKE